MKMRSWLFVPGDSERKLAKIPDCGADVVVLDLEDSIAPGNKAAARERVATYLADADRAAVPPLWVRVNPLISDYCDGDLERVASARPDGILLPKADGIIDVNLLDQKLTEIERVTDREPGAIKMIVTATETVLGVENLSGYVDHPERLVALTWGAEDLAAELGADGNRDADGNFRPLFAYVRAQFRLAAAVAGLPAIDTIHANYGDAKGLAEYARIARADGFVGMLAIHPAQVPIINEAFKPTADDVADARRVVAAFENGAGVAALDGRMLDRPHLAQARRVLEIAGLLD